MIITDYWNETMAHRLLIVPRATVGRLIEATNYQAACASVRSIVASERIRLGTLNLQFDGEVE